MIIFKIAPLKMDVSRTQQGDISMPMIKLCLQDALCILMCGL